MALYTDPSLVDLSHQHHSDRLSVSWVRQIPGKKKWETNP
jgi:hypothetical protein